MTPSISFQMTWEIDENFFEKKARADDDADGDYHFEQKASAKLFSLSLSLRVYLLSKSQMKDSVESVTNIIATSHLINKTELVYFFAKWKKAHIFDRLTGNCSGKITHRHTESVRGNQ